jgi:hypothetical protein
MVVKFRNTNWSPPPQLSLHRRAALASDSNGTRSYIAERTQNAVYIVRCLWMGPKRKKAGKKKIQMKATAEADDLKKVFPKIVNKNRYVCFFVRIS